MPKKDVKLSQNVNGNGKKKKKKNKRPISKFMTIFMIVSLALLIFQIIKLNLLPAKLIVLVSLVMIILCLIILLILHFKAKKFLPRILAGFVALCMCVGLAYGNYFIYKTDNSGQTSST
jgi:polyisoprenyl-teichoic acid--peptidoglycan teichoic acid transferase